MNNMSNQNTESLLVTGGAGFLGAHVVRSLLTDTRYSEMQIVVLDDLSGGFEENLPQNDRLTFVRGSILDSGLVDRLFQKNQFRYVFHLAAYAAEGLSHFIRRFNYQNNLLGSMNLINASVNFGIKHFVFTSSIAVYGAAQLPMTEDTIPSPEDPYGIAKLAVELDLKAAAEMFGLPFTVFRPHNVYGEFQNLGDRYRNVVGIFMNQIMQQQPLTIFGDGTQQRAFTYVADLMNPLLSSPFIPAANGQIFNVGAGTPVSVLELAELVCEEFQVAHDIRHLDARNEVHTAWSDHSRCQSVFGDHQDTSLKEGLNKMAKWARQSGSRSSQSFDQIEILKNLPASWSPNS